MFGHRLATVLAFLFAFPIPAAQAFWDPPYIAPASPVAGETISMEIRIGVCDAILYWPGYPQITRHGNAITIVTYGQHWDPGELCTYPTGTATYEVGSFEPGNYTLTVDLNYLDFFSQPQTLTLGVVAFTVAGIAPPAVPTPTMSPLGLLALLLVLSASAFWTLRSRRAGMLLVIATASSPLAARSIRAQSHRPDSRDECGGRANTGANRERLRHDTACRTAPAVGEPLHRAPSVVSAASVELVNSERFPNPGERGKCSSITLRRS